MEPDRYHHSPKVYIIGLICMIMSMLFFGLGAYALPHIAFGLTYRIPTVIYNWISWIHLAYDVPEKKAGLWVLMIIFILGFIASIVTYSVSNRIEKELYSIESEKTEAHAQSNEWKETIPLALKIIFILVVVFVSAQLFHWAISIE